MQFLLRFVLWVYYGVLKHDLVQIPDTMHGSENVQAPPILIVFLSMCDKIYNTQEVWFLLYVLGQIVTWQYNPNLLD